jgi:hypothetical protein
VVLDTLAVAAAGTGDFRTAVEMGTRALELARRGVAAGTMDRGLAERMAGRLEQYYRRGRAYHGPP